MTSIVTARMDREIEAEPKALGDFGLDRPAAEATLKLKDGKQIGLVLGAKSPTGVWVYAREAGKPAVFVVGDSVLRDTTRPVAEFRDKTVLAFEQRDVTGLELDMRDEKIALEQADGRWKVTKPRPLPADADTVRDFLDKLRAARVKEFAADAPKSLEPFGLDKPVRLDVQTGREKDRATKTLLIGRADPAKKGVYAMRPGESSVLLIPDETWTAVPKNLAVLRDKSVVGFDRDKVTKIEIESPKGTVTIAKDGDRWKITAPQALAADQVEAGAVLFKLRDLRAQAFLTDDASGIPRYLAKPTVRVNITEQGASAPRTGAAGALDREARRLAQRLRGGGGPGAGGAGRRQGARGSGPIVRRSARPHPHVRARAARHQAHACACRRPDRRGRAERESDWKLVEGGSGAAKSATVDNLLYSLRALKWKTIAAPTGDEPAKYGLDAPTFEVTLLKADGSEAGALLVGKREGDQAWVKLKTAPAIYTVDVKQLGETPKVPNDFKS